MRRLLPLLVLVLVLAGCGGTGSVRTQEKAKLASTPVAIVVAAGDIACPPGSPVTKTTCRQAATASLVRSLKPQKVIALGDLQYQKGSYADFLGSYAKTWGTFRDRTIPVPGNHEYYTAGAAGYYKYWAGKTTKPGYYRTAINGWQVYVLNTNCDRVDCAAERTWLAGALKAHPSRCAMIVGHHPRFSSGGEHGSALFMQSFWRIAQAAKVDVALSGHDHDYERFAPKLATGTVSAGGIRQFVSGAGGKSLYKKGATVAGSRFFLNTAPGVLRLRLTPTAYSWQYRDIWGKIRDSGTSACH
ncbi:MAG: metallophosphoesterase [Nocardioidaceae bacterium]|nr:metallophosphoesterase [Nocardioidaceae bacterium]